jgi:ATP-dependent DNA helicase RecG
LNPILSLHECAAAEKDNLLSAETPAQHKGDSPDMKESQQVEWKSAWRDDYLRWICGFANAEGGKLVIGRDDRGMAVGVSNARQLLEELPNKIRDVLGIMADVRLVKEARKELVEIRVEPYPSPISYKGEYHYRSGSTKQELKGAALERFLLKKRGRHWDDAPEPAFTVRSLSRSPPHEVPQGVHQLPRFTEEGDLPLP